MIHHRGRFGYFSQIYRLWVPFIMMVGCIIGNSYSPPVSIVQTVHPYKKKGDKDDVGDGNLE
jgi:hypothetical protein